MSNWYSTTQDDLHGLHMKDILSEINLYFQANLNNLGEADIAMFSNYCPETVTTTLLFTPTLEEIARKIGAKPCEPPKNLVKFKPLAGDGRFKNRYLAL